MTQAELSRRTGIATTTINRWKEKEASPDSLHRVASALGISIDELLGRRSAANPPQSSRIATVAAELGLDQGALDAHAVAALNRLLRVIADTSGTNLPHTMYPTRGGVGGMANLIESKTWNSLTRDQQAGLALLVDGREVEQWRIQAALELLFAGGVEPGGGGERVTSVVRTR